MNISRTGSAGVFVMMALFGILAGSVHAEQRVYWCQGLEGASMGSRLKRMNLDGAASETFADTGCLEHVAASPFFTRQLFFVADDASLIKQASLDTGAVSSWIGFPGNSAVGLAVDLGVNGPVYFAYNSGGTGTIWRANFDATNITFILSTAREIQDLALDTIANKLYWVEPNGIHRANQTGSGSELVEAGTTINSVAVDSGAQQYWYTTGNTVQGRNISGAPPAITFSANRPTKGVAVDGLGKVYWYEISNAGGRILRTCTDVFAACPFETLVDLGTNIDDLTSFIGLEVGFFSCGITDVFGDVDDNGVPNFADISLVVNCFQGVNCSNAQFNRSDLSPCNAAFNTCQGDAKVDFQDVNKAVSAFQGGGCL